MFCERVSSAADVVGVKLVVTPHTPVHDLADNSKAFDGPTLTDTLSAVHQKLMMMNQSNAPLRQLIEKLEVAGL